MDYNKSNLPNLKYTLLNTLLLNATFQIAACNHGAHVLQVRDLTAEPCQRPSGPLAEWWPWLQLIRWLFVREWPVSCKLCVYVKRPLKMKPKRAPLTPPSR